MDRSRPPRPCKLLSRLFRLKDSHSAPRLQRSRGQLFMTLIRPRVFRNIAWESSTSLPAQMVLDIGYNGSHAVHITEIYPLEVASLASPSNPVNCGLPTGCVTTTTSAAANVLSRYPYVGFAALSATAD